MVAEEEAAVATAAAVLQHSSVRPVVAVEAAVRDMSDSNRLNGSSLNARQVAAVVAGNNTSSVSNRSMLNASRCSTLSVSRCSTLSASSRSTPSVSNR